MISPNDPRWEPDASGQRLRAIRAARHGAFLAAILFGPIVGIGVAIAPPESFGAPSGAGILGLVMALPGLALLGAALTPAALGSRFSAATAGLAMGVGGPVAAVTSAMLSVWIVVGMLVDHDTAGDVAGLVLRDGVTVAVRLSPVLAIACVAWVAGVRRASPGSAEAS